jgi:hypothetical protein
MANQFFNFYYDPVRQGYDTDTWSTLTGAPIVVSNKLSLKSSSIAHFADLLRGDISFCVNINAPIAGDTVKFGVGDFNDVEGAFFNIKDDVFTVFTQTDGATTSVTVPWVSDWTSTDTVFRIKWEAGSVKFYVGGQLKATISTTIPNEPLYLYALSTSAVSLKIKYIEVMSTESSILNLS